MRTVPLTPKKASLRKVLATATVVALAFGASACGADEGEDGETASQSASEDAASDGEGSSDEAEGQEPDLEGIPDVVATVDGTDISKDEFVETYTNQFTQQSQQAQMTGQPVDQDALRKQTVETMVDRTLLVAEVDKRKVSASQKDLDASLDKMAEQNGLKDGAEFLAALKEQGMEEDEVRSELELQVRVEKMIAEESGAAEPTGKEIRKYYADLVAQQEAAAEGESAAPQQELPPLKEVRGQIAEQLTAQKQSETIRALLEELRADAKIETHL